MTNTQDQGASGLTPDRATLLELAERCERCERAEGADRELDLRIEAAVNPEYDGLDEAYARFLTQYGKHPKYTASLDAAMSLVPEGWDWSAGTATVEGFRPAYAEASPQTQPFPVEMDISAEAATPALALVAAALRARAHKPPMRPKEASMTDNLEARLREEALNEAIEAVRGRIAELTGDRRLDDELRYELNVAISRIETLKSRTSLKETDHGSDTGETK